MSDAYQTSSLRLMQVMDYLYQHFILARTEYTNSEKEGEDFDATIISYYSQYGPNTV